MNPGDFVYVVYQGSEVSGQVIRCDLDTDSVLIDVRSSSGAQLCIVRNACHVRSQPSSINSITESDEDLEISIDSSALSLGVANEDMDIDLDDEDKSSAGLESSGSSSIFAMSPPMLSQHINSTLKSGLNHRHYAADQNIQQHNTDSERGVYSEVSQDEAEAAQALATLSHAAPNRQRTISASAALQSSKGAFVTPLSHQQQHHFSQALHVQVDQTQSDNLLCTSPSHTATASKYSPQLLNQSFSSQLSRSAPPAQSFNLFSFSRSNSGTLLLSPILQPNSASMPSTSTAVKHYNFSSILSPHQENENFITPDNGSVSTTMSSTALIMIPSCQLREVNTGTATVAGLLGHSSVTPNLTSADSSYECAVGSQPINIPLIRSRYSTEPSSPSHSFTAPTTCSSMSEMVTSCYSATISTNSSRRVRSEIAKCRKIYGIENRNQWCTQCRWKKACTRFPDSPVSNHAAASLDVSAVSADPSGALPNAHHSTKPYQATLSALLSGASTRLLQANGRSFSPRTAHLENLTPMSLEEDKVECVSTSKSHHQSDSSSPFSSSMSVESSESSVNNISDALSVLSPLQLIEQDSGHSAHATVDAHATMTYLNFEKSAS